MGRNRKKTSFKKTQIQVIMEKNINTYNYRTRFRFPPPCPSLSVLPWPKKPQRQTNSPSSLHHCGTLTVALSPHRAQGKKSLHWTGDSLLDHLLPAWSAFRQRHSHSPTFTHPCPCWRLHKPEIYSPTYFSHYLSLVSIDSTHCRYSNTKDQCNHTHCLASNTSGTNRTQSLPPNPAAGLLCSWNHLQSHHTHPFQALPWCQIQQYPQVSCFCTGCSLTPTLLPLFTYGDLISNLIFGCASPSRNWPPSLVSIHP